jgi:glycosyltransferase involved in cell wall biosynthesis
VRIGIDASWAAVTGTGTASYTNGLVRALIEHEEHDFVLYFRPGDDSVNPLFSLCRPNVESRVVAGRSQADRTIVSLTRAAARDRLDVFHSPGYFLPLWNGPKIVTFHDANMFLEWRRWWRPGLRLSWLSLCSQAILASRLAHTIVSDSTCAATSVERVLRLPPRSVSVLYPGVDDMFFEPPDEQGVNTIRERHALQSYLLFLSVLSPQKNLEGVVRAYAALNRTDLKLAIAGREDGPYFHSVIRPLIRALGLERRVAVLGIVPSPALPGLYAAAEVFLFPSFAEGFGLPPIEAMACGTPVVASNRTSLPEVLGDAALLVDPERVQDIAAACQTILADRKLRDTLVQRGTARAARFRWQGSAARALELYAASA